MLIFLLLLLLPTTSHPFYGRYLLTRDIIQSLDEWERVLLRDFVRGKGRGSVSRIPVELLNEPPSGIDATQEENFVSFMTPPESTLRAGPIMSVPGEMLKSISITAKPKKSRKEERPVSSVISPASKVRRRLTGSVSLPAQNHNRTHLEEPSQETFKELSGLLQTFIDRRKPFLKRVTVPPPASTTPPHNLHGENLDRPASDTSAMGQWKAMDPHDNDDNDDVKQNKFTQTKLGDSHEDWEAKMRELSAQLSTILMQIKKAKEIRQLKFNEKAKPKVIILRNGSANQTNDGRYNFVATITLVQDTGKNILVDTGLGTDINGRTNLISALEKHDLVPQNVNIVVTTHGHPDHVGGVHDFPDAIHYQGWYIHHHTTFNLSGLFEGDRHSLTDNIYLMRSIGHTSDDIAVVVSEERTMGKVIIAGDTFLRREDLDYPMMWKPLSANETDQARSRRNMICESSWIIPGHGPPFQTMRDPAASVVESVAQDCVYREGACPRCLEGSSLVTQTETMTGMKRELRCRGVRKNGSKDAWRR